MNGKQLLGVIVLVFGFIILLGGLAMPSMTTATSTTCYDDPFSYGQDCVESTYETSNSSKPPTIMFGLIITIVGSWALKSGGTSSKSNRTPQSSSDNSQWTGDSQSSEATSDNSQWTDNTSNQGFEQKVKEAHNEKK